MATGRLKPVGDNCRQFAVLQRLNLIFQPSTPSTMLQAIRGHANTWYAKLLFVVLLFAFSFFGIQSFLSSAQRAPILIKVGNVELDGPTVGSKLNAEMRRYQQALGGQIDRQQMKSLGLLDKAIDRIVMSVALELDTKHLGIVVSDALVRQSIESEQAFFDDKGKFSRARFTAVLSQVGYPSEQAFTSEIRRQIATSQVLHAIISGAAAPAILVDTLARYRAERRVAQTVFIADDPTSKLSAPTEAELQALYKADPGQFTAPEYRAISYAVLSAAAIGADMKVTDAELHEAYTSRSTEFVTPEHRKVEQISFADEASAKAAREKIGPTLDFAALAKLTGQQASDTQLGDVTEADLPPDYAPAAFALPLNDISQPVKDDFGWHLLRVTQITPGHTQEFDAVKDKLTQELIEQRSIDALYDRANKLEETLDGGASLDDAAKSLNLPVRKIAAIDQSGKSPDGTTVKDVPAPTSLLANAFELKDGQTGRPVEVRDQNLYLVTRVDAVTPPALQSFEQVRPKIVQLWETQARERAAKARAEALAAKLKAGMPIDVLAKAEKLTLTTTPPFTRDGKGAKELPIAATQPLFDATAPGAVAVVRAVGDNGYIVAELKSIEAVDTAKDKDTILPIQAELKQQIQGDIVEGYQAALKKIYPVTIDRPAIDKTF